MPDLNTTNDNSTVLDKIRPDFLYSIKQVSQWSGLSVSTIWRGVKNESFPKPVKVCGSTRWRGSSLLALSHARDAA